MAQAHPPNETQQPQEHDERHQATEEKQGGGAVPTSKNITT